MRVPAWSGEGPLVPRQVADFSMSPHMVEGNQGALSGTHLTREGFTLTTNHFPKAPPPNNITLVYRLSTHEFGGTIAVTFHLC